MRYLLDTNIISELTKPKIAESVKQWFATVQSQNLYLSVLTIGEIRKGVNKMADILKQEKLRIWLENDLPKWFEGRILAIDHNVANQWGVLQAEAKKPIPAIDSIIAATAIYHNLQIVTRNTQDFQYVNCRIINPWNM